jgi:hypothetical protein
MPLLDLKTDLKSLRFGKDRLGGGNSGQPYITSPIPEETNNLGILNNDFLLRGGITAVTNSGEDVLRLGKMFIDTKSPSGILFTAKQQLLSRTSNRTQTSGILNEGIYTPLSTLAQAGVNAFGGHLNKQGINPFAQTGAYSNNDNLYGVKVKWNQPKEENRLVAIYQNITDNTSQNNWNFSGVDLNVGPNILSYGGGPGSVLGIGKTHIRFASPEQRTGINNPNYKGNSTPNQELPKYTPTENLLNFKTFLSNSNNKGKEYNGIIVKNSYITLSSPPFVNAATGLLDPLGVTQYPSTYTTTQLEEAKPDTELGRAVGIKQDFRKILRQDISSSKVISISPDYQTQNIQTRTNIGNPGDFTRNLISYTSGSGLGPLDKINALPLYSSTSVTTDPIVNDLVKFRIAIIDNTDPSKKVFIHFRAFLDSFTDSYSANWNSQQYLGRGEKFYTYGGFERTFSMGWTVAAQSKEELIPMYKKLNYLASSLTPDYSGNGYMKGNMAQLTVGGYLYEQPGIITGLSLSVDENSPYEIGINDEGGSDRTVKELPMIIKVTGFNFIPIHNFRPEKQKNIYATRSELADIGTLDQNYYGNQKYIALSNGEDDKFSNYNYKQTGIIEGEGENARITGFIPNVEAPSPTTGGGASAAAASAAANTA